MIPRFVVTLLLAGVSLAHLLAGASVAHNTDSGLDPIVQSSVSDKQFMGSVLSACGDKASLGKGYCAATSAGPAGADTYRVKLDSGSWECRIVLGSDGKIEAFGIRRINE